MYRQSDEAVVLAVGYSPPYHRREEVMGGLSTTAKYMIYADIEVDGIVEKSDVIGGIFGQTEGLLGEDLDLRELQKSGRIGRIEVKLEVRGHRSVGEITIPSNLDRAETALIAAAIETVDKIGPYNAKIRVKRIKDLREEKRKRIIERAKEILRAWESEEAPESRKLTEEVLKAIRSAELIKYGPEGLPAGPEVDKSDTIIVVEGRADVINLLKHGYRNVIAVEGATIPKTVVELSKRKKVIAFVDGDRGGEIILRNLVEVADVDFVARAPPGREVEELTGKEIAKALKNPIPVEEYLREVGKERKVTVSQEEAFEAIIPDSVKEEIVKLKGTLEGVLYGEDWKPVRRIAVRNLVKVLNELSDEVKYLVFDGVITQRILDVAFSKGIKLIIASRVGNVVKQPEEVKMLTFKDLGI